MLAVCAEKGGREREGEGNNSIKLASEKLNLILNCSINSRGRGLEIRGGLLQREVWELSLPLCTPPSPYHVQFAAPFDP